MPELEIVRRSTPVGISFTTAPIYNALTSLFLLREDSGELINWVSTLNHPLTPAQLEVNGFVSRAAFSYLHGDTTSSFPDWIELFAQRDARELVESEARELIAFAKVYHPQETSFPTAEAVRTDLKTYLDLTRKIVLAQKGSFKTAFYEAEFDRLQQPEVRKNTMVQHLRWVWDKLLQQEWQRIEPLIQDSVNAYQNLSFSNISRKDVIHKITGFTQIPSHWDIWLPLIEELVFIPSIHIGENLLLAEVHEQKAYILFPAHIPEGTEIASPALNRTELLMRLRALADDTRLLILDLVAGKGPQTAQDVMETLELSQSSASRNLSQLSTAGYLRIQKKEGVKTYTLAIDRIEDTFSRLKNYLQQ
ncbi:MAG: helix-turn-helix transcriptional regulator [Anaerolineales bacterium]|nr:helix-turn-helix transcriptional regulator [Anaerolineales bacterium]